AAAILNVPVLTGASTLTEDINLLSYNKVSKKLYLIVKYASSLTPTSANTRFRYTIVNMSKSPSAITYYNYTY
ncbi:hypothetical protein OFL77_27095, partial [Escherichia coli]|uniref:hypothetical protein n=1 Tax=Escherichia coli TaxID=562 RepID=UPI0021E01D58